ncbi:hypothetical protein ACQJBY_030018 [Aegilops geniculata]
MSIRKLTNSDDSNNASVEDIGYAGRTRCNTEPRDDILVARDRVQLDEGRADVPGVDVTNVQPSRNDDSATLTQEPGGTTEGGADVLAQTSGRLHRHDCEHGYTFRVVQCRKLEAARDKEQSVRTQESEGPQN